MTDFNTGSPAYPRSRPAVACAALLLTLMLTLLMAACGQTASAKDSAARDGTWLKREIEQAAAEAVIDVPAGHYDMKDVYISRDLTLRGPQDGEAILHSPETTDKGLLIPLAGVSLTVENLVFRDANSWDRNGAGIRHEGRDLTIRNCVFDNNEDGLLATGDPRGVITIRNTAFIDSGFGDGQSHAIYVVNAALLDIRDSRFVGTRIGHHVKSLADRTVLANSYLDDAHGRSSYAVDASKGGDVAIIGNTVIQSADSDNSAIFNYDLTRGGEAVSLVIEKNTITNHYNGGRLLRNDSPLAPVVRDNEIINEGRRPLKTH